MEHPAGLPPAVQQSQPDLKTEPSPTEDLVLRVEQINKGQARALQYTVWLMLAVLSFLALALIVASLSNRGAKGSVVSKLSWYQWQLILGSILLGILLLMSIVFAHRIGYARRHHKTWDRQRQLLLIDGAVVTFLVVSGPCHGKGAPFPSFNCCNAANSSFNCGESDCSFPPPGQVIGLACYVASYALVVAKRCLASKIAINVLGYIRTSTNGGLLAWMVFAAGSMRTWRPSTPKGADPERPEDHRHHADILVADAPTTVQLKRMWAVILIFGIFEVANTVGFILGVINKVVHDHGIPVESGTQCPTDVHCPIDAQQIITVVAGACITFIFMGLHWYAVSGALRDHQHLPYQHYKLAHIFVCNQRRYARVLFLALIMSDVLLQLASLGTCDGAVNAKVRCIGP